MMENDVDGGNDKNATMVNDNLTVVEVKKRKKQKGISNLTAHPNKM